MVSPRTSLWLCQTCGAPICISQVQGAEAPASSQEAWALLDAVPLSHCLATAHLITSRSICSHICEMVVGLGRREGPSQSGVVVVWGLLQALLQEDFVNDGGGDTLLIPGLSYPNR